MPRQNRSRILLALAASALVIVFLLGVAVQGLRHRSSQLLAREMTPIRVMFRSIDHPISSLALSPNGEYLAYGDSGGVSIRELRTGTTREIPDSKGLKVWWWRGDSSEVLGSRLSPYEVAYAIPLTGAAPRRLGGAMPSPAGKYTIALDNDRRNVKRLADGRTFSVARNGSHHRPWILWSPDETHLVARFPSTDESWVEMLDLTNGRWKTVIPSHRGPADMGWISNQRLIFSEQETYPRFDSNLWEIDVDASRHLPIRDPTQLTHWIGFYLGHLSVASPGNRLCLQGFEYSPATLKEERSESVWMLDHP